MSLAGRDREDLAALLLRLRSERLQTPGLLGAAEAVPRRLFVPPGTDNAYSDRALPLACGQTMPGADASIRLVDALKLADGARVLEIGTGSGYVAALIASLGAKLISLERFRRLVEAASEALRGSNLTQVALQHCDGAEGLPEEGPFDRILVHGVFATVPRALLVQLAPQGYLVCAVGPALGAQRLMRVRRAGSRHEEEFLGQVYWQPLLTGVAAAI